MEYKHICKKWKMKIGIFLWNVNIYICKKYKNICMINNFTNFIGFFHDFGDVTGVGIAKFR
jgi:hypothetical protein